MNMTISDTELEQMITRLGIHATPATSFTSVEDGYVEALREVLRLRAELAQAQSERQQAWIANAEIRQSKEDVVAERDAENARLTQLLSGRDENLLSRETHE